MAKPRTALALLVAASLFVVAGLAGRLPIGQTRFDTLADKALGETPSISWMSTVILVAPERLRPTLRRWAGTGGGVLGSPLDLNLTPAPDRVFRMSNYYLGPAPSVRVMDIHLSALLAGELPHPTHIHLDEELIVPLAGELDVLLGPDGTDREERMGPGSFRFYASEEPHTLRGVGPEPSRYLIFKWHGLPAERPGALQSRVYDYAPLLEQLRSGDPKASRALVFEGPTEHLETLHVHASLLRPGGGYPPHGDPYDVALVLLKGSFETAGQRYDAPSVVFFPADIPHGMANPTDEPAEYLAIEFHGPGLKLGDHVH